MPSCALPFLVEESTRRKERLTHAQRQGRGPNLIPRGCFCPQLHTGAIYTRSSHLERMLRLFARQHEKSIMGKRGGIVHNARTALALHPPYHFLLSYRAYSREIGCEFANPSSNVIRTLFRLIRHAPPSSIGLYSLARCASTRSSVVSRVVSSLFRPNVWHSSPPIEHRR